MQPRNNDRNSAMSRVTRPVQPVIGKAKVLSRTARLNQMRSPWASYLNFGDEKLKSLVATVQDDPFE
ncbi:hypothetical protein CHU98_g7274 [Xylaria longipes]|nr:hypothetical protein CHU98_g7274 [Xylaria longipes]